MPFNTTSTMSYRMPPNYVNPYISNKQLKVTCNSVKANADPVPVPERMESKPCNVTWTRFPVRSEYLRSFEIKPSLDNIAPDTVKYCKTISANGNTTCHTVKVDMMTQDQKDDITGVLQEALNFALDQEEPSHTGIANQAIKSWNQISVDFGNYQEAPFPSDLD